METLDLEFTNNQGLHQIEKRDVPGIGATLPTRWRHTGGNQPGTLHLHLGSPHTCP